MDDKSGFKSFMGGLSKKDKKITKMEKKESFMIKDQNEIAAYKK